MIDVFMFYFLCIDQENYHHHITSLGLSIFKNICTVLKVYIIS